MTEQALVIEAVTLVEVVAVDRAGNASIVCERTVHDADDREAGMEDEAPTKYSMGIRMTRPHQQHWRLDCAGTDEHNVGGDV